MKYQSARRLFEESWTIPYGWHYCSFHKDIESNVELCPAAVLSGQARPLGAMKWTPTDAGTLQCLLEEVSDRLHRHLYVNVCNRSKNVQPQLASPGLIL